MIKNDNLVRCEKCIYIYRYTCYVKKWVIWARYNTLSSNLLHSVIYRDKKPFGGYICDPHSSPLSKNNK